MVDAAPSEIAIATVPSAVIPQKPRKRAWQKPRPNRRFVRISVQTIELEPARHMTKLHGRFHHCPRSTHRPAIKKECHAGKPKAQSSIQGAAFRARYAIRGT